MSFSLFGVILFLTAIIVINEIIATIASHVLLSIAIAIGFAVPAACFAYRPARMRRENISHPRKSRARR